MAGDGDEENSGVEGHHGQHDDISQAEPEGVQEGLDQTGPDPVGRRTGDRLDEAAVAEPLDDGGENEDEDEGQHVHAGS